MNSIGDRHTHELVSSIGRRLHSKRLGQPGLQGCSVRALQRSLDANTCRCFGKTA